MRKIILTVLLLVIALSEVLAQDKHTLTVEFSGMKTNKGDLFVAVYDTKENFLKKPFKTKIVTVQNNKAIVTFENIASGYYAVSSFHDENDNKKMDTKIFGIPKEPIGISNDAVGFMGPPKFSEAKFALLKDETIQINVN